MLVKELGKDHATCMLSPGAVPGPFDVSASISQCVMTLSHPGSSGQSPVRHPRPPLPGCQQHVMVEGSSLGTQSPSAQRSGSPLWD